MARLVVLTNPALADGFRLAGCDHRRRPGPAEAARPCCAALVADDDVGLLLVTADLWAALDERLRGQLERLGHGRSSCRSRPGS